MKNVFLKKIKNGSSALKKKYYHHLADLILESVRNFSISLEEAQERMECHNAEVVNRFYREGRSVILCGGHYGNWELWAVSSSSTLEHKILGVYKKLSNPFFDKKMIESRGRFGMTLIPTKKAGEYLRENPDELKALVLAFDQSPASAERSIWVNFLGRKTASYYGLEKYAREFNMPVIYGHLVKKKRGFYSISYELIYEFPREVPELEMTQCLYDILAREIHREPAYWLWSHKRWKHRQPAGT